MTTPLLAIPNVSEGRDRQAIGAVAAAFDARLLDVHLDPDHHRSVFTLAGAPGQLAGAVLSGAAEVIRRVDVNRHVGIHPRVGAIDVAPIVYLSDEERGAACAEALVLADLLSVELATGATLAQAREIAARIREGGPDGLPGVRAIGVWLEHRQVAQVSTNIEDHSAVTLAGVVEAIARHAEVFEAELVGLAPRAALADFPDGVPLRGRQTIEDALQS